MSVAPLRLLRCHAVRRARYSTARHPLFGSLGLLSSPTVPEGVLLSWACRGISPLSAAPTKTS
eukprot:8535669-Pyramimonas_sp.AAC.1